MECSVFMRATGIRFAQAGYAVFGIDQEGHGKSEGRRCYVESFQALVDDSIAFFKSIRGTYTYSTINYLSRYLLVEPVIDEASTVQKYTGIEITMILIPTDLEENQNMPHFLYGESMGGAIALHIHRKEPVEWTGAVLQAPMCKISESVKPPSIVTSILTKLAGYIPTWKIVPAANIIDNAFKDPIKREEVAEFPNKLPISCTNLSILIRFQISS